jgi:hypothetical protein
MSNQNQFQSNDEGNWDALEKILISMPPSKLINLADYLESLPQSSEDSWERFSYPHPIEFAEKVLDIKRYMSKRQRELGLPWYTPDQKKFFDSCVAHKRTLALSGNAVGKTFCMAIVALWLYHLGYMVLTTAPTLLQLQDALWGQIREFRKRAKPGMGGRWLDVKMEARFGPKHFMKGYTVRTDGNEDIASPFQGRHAELIALLIDEIGAIPESILEAGDVVCVNDNAKIIGAGNPHDRNAPIKKLSEVPGLWNTITISCENHPNFIYDEEIIPGATTRKVVKEQLAKCGGNRDAALFRSTVLGLFPGNSEDSLIDEAWIIRAQERGRKERIEDWRGKALGVDVAGEGGDLSGGVVCDKAKIKFPKVRNSKPCWIRGQDILESVTLVRNILDAEPDIRVICIDATGVGDGPTVMLQKERDKFPTYSLINKKTLTLQEQKMQRASIVSVKFSHKPDNDIIAERFEKVKDQMWWEFREALRNNEVDLPTNEELAAAGFPSDSNLIEQLKRPIFFQNARGAIIVLDRRGVGGQTEEVRERARNLPSKSPDVAHMVLLAWRGWSRMLKDGERPITSMEDIDLARWQAIRQNDKNRKDRKPQGRWIPWRRGR